MRPEDNVRVHGTDERISVDNCALGVRFYRRVITEAGGAPK
jgi:acetylornithine deacetylase/succinyl-diaminopimelate desuccinylase-like protein